MKKVAVEIVLLDEMLGTLAANRETVEEFIASKSGDAKKIKEELEALPAEELLEKFGTVFPRDKDGDPIIWDYQIKGFIKAAMVALGDIDGSLLDTKEKQKKYSLTKWTYKRTVDNFIHVFPRKIKINFPKDGEMGECQRPLRAETMKGERVALAKSETVPEGSTFECEIHCLNEKLEPVLREALDFGKYNGLLQWRNSGKGRFSWTEKK